MKKQIMTIALVLGLCMTALAQQAGGGLLYRGERRHSGNDRGYIGSNDPFFLPVHGGIFNGDADVDPGPDPFDPPVPVGGGTLLLVGFGAAYAMTKRNKKD
ncbi:MAG: hypothetical protein K6A94_09325 [Bacteroidales bacterium]|nr:hypothetical protein [Bacteroidales bacterium]